MTFPIQVWDEHWCVSIVVRTANKQPCRAPELCKTGPSRARYHGRASEVIVESYNRKINIRASIVKVISTTAFIEIEISPLCNENRSVR